MKVLNISNKVNKMIHFIGEYYKYPNSNKRFKLVEVIGYKYLFACGHWCTDSVFEDLIRCKTGVQNYMNNQLELF